MILRKKAAWSLLLLSFLLLGNLGVCALTPSKRDMVGVSNPAPFALAPSRRAIADFDGDQHLDVAIGTPGTHSYKIEIRFQPGRRYTELEIAKQELWQVLPGIPVTLAAVDVDADNDQDLLIFSSLLQQLPMVWINDGHGKFTRSVSALLPYGESSGSHIEPQRLLMTALLPTGTRLVEDCQLNCQPAFLLSPAKPVTLWTRTALANPLPIMPAPLRGPPPVLLPFHT